MTDSDVPLFFQENSDPNDNSLGPESKIAIAAVSDEESRLELCDAERVDVVSDGEEPPAGQEGFVQQLAKQEAVPRASEQKVIDEDDEQGHNLIKDQFYNGFRDQLIRTFQTVSYTHLTLPTTPYV